MNYCSIRVSYLYLTINKPPSPFLVVSSDDRLTGLRPLGPLRITRLNECHDGEDILNLVEIGE